MLAFPPAVYPADTPIAELQTAEMFLVATLRLWAAPHRDPTEHHAHWHQGFAAARLEDGMTAFDALLRIVATAAQRLLDVRCVHCLHLGEDEAWFLQLISLLQRNRRQDAAMIMADWLPPAAARVALPYGIVLAAAMEGHGLTVPHRPSGTAHGAGRGCDHVGTPRLSLVH
jgi:hypothetical protein